MACQNPLWQHKIDYVSGKKIPGIYVQWPCRWCINCRIDRKNYWKDRLDYEHLNKISSAFVTFTYDEWHLPKNGSLCREDFKKLITNLRQRTRKQLPSDLCKKNWTYYGCGEYGDKYGRPHYHILFFGLDFWDCKQLFNTTWHGGIVDSLPILNGGIGYVLSYMDKQLFGKMSLEKYEANGLESPFASWTPGIGSKLFESQIDYLIKNGSYKNLAGIERPLAPYYIQKYAAKKEFDRYPQKLKQMEHEHGKNFSLDKVDDYEQELLYARARYYGEKMRQKRHAVDIPEDRQHQKYCSVRQYMYRQYKKNAVKEFEAINNEIMTELYKHQGERIHA